MIPNSGVWKGSENEIQRRRESCLWSVCDMNIRRALQPRGNWLSDAHIIPLCGPSLIPVSSTFFTVIPLCLLSPSRAEKEEMHSTHRWLFLSENQINKKRFLWWGCIVVNFMLIWKCLLDYIRGILPAYPDVIVCLTVGSKSEFRESQIWISGTTNGKKQWWEMNRRGSCLSITRYLRARYFTSDSFSRAKHWPRQDCRFTVSSPAWLCTAVLLSATLPPKHCCKSSDCLLATPCLENESGRIYSCWLLGKPRNTQWLKRHWRSASIRNIFIKGRTPGLWKR